MERSFRRWKLVALLSFIIILLADFCLQRIIPEWTFVYDYLVIVYNIIVYCSFFGLLFCIILLFRANVFVTALFGSMLGVILLLSIYLEIYPLDTSTKPRDVLVLTKYNNGQKLVVRKMQNAKTLAEISDTVLVDDFWIFRRVQMRKTPQ